jgi:hypothetical protein
MRFFTPELYVRGNSPDDSVADHAAAEWEEALGRYQAHLAAIRGQLPERVRQLAEDVCLHDFELIQLQEELARLATTNLARERPTRLLVLNLRGRDRTINLFYLVPEAPEHKIPFREWPFQSGQTYWLYDEIDVSERPGAAPSEFVHRVLLSDGRVLTIPFTDVVINVLVAGESASDDRVRQPA